MNDLRALRQGAFLAGVVFPPRLRVRTAPAVPDNIALMVTGASTSAVLTHTGYGTRIDLEAM